MTSKIEELIIRYLNGACSEEDLNNLSDWVSEPDNKALFRHYVEVDYALNHHLKTPDIDIQVEKLLGNIRKENKATFKLSKKRTLFYAAAAAFAGLLVLGYWQKESIQVDTKKNSIPVIVNNQIETGTDKATLTLADGKNVVLEEGEVYDEGNLYSNGKEIIYEKIDATAKVDQVVYNVLTIPRGGQFFIRLADDTKVWLNSESKLRYPTQFNAGQDRTVELVYGEAFFEVSPSEEHQGSRFKVIQSANEVVVLGTQFNISAYKDDAIVKTTLVEGKIVMNTQSEGVILEPGQQLALNKQKNSIEINEVDTYVETAWRKGLFVFRATTLNEITKTLSRWYDTDFVFATENLKEIQFRGVLGKDQSIEDILNSIKNSSEIKNYEIYEKTVTMK